jgi:hypothetical protein
MKRKSCKKGANEKVKKQLSIDMQIQQFHTNITLCDFESCYGFGPTKMMWLRNPVQNWKEFLCRTFVITVPAPWQWCYLSIFLPLSDQFCYNDTALQHLKLSLRLRLQLHYNEKALQQCTSYFATFLLISHWEQGRWDTNCLNKIIILPFFIFVTIFFRRYRSFWDCSEIDCWAYGRPELR